MKRDAALDETAGDQALARHVVATGIADAVEALDVLGLGIEVDRLRSGRLHAVGQLVALDPRRQLGLGGESIVVKLVGLVQESQLRPLAIVASFRAAARGRRSVGPRGEGAYPGKSPAEMRRPSSPRGPWGARGPSGSLITTNPGRFSASLPRPYVTHEPTHGKPMRGIPVFIMNRAGE